MTIATVVAHMSANYVNYVTPLLDYATSLQQPCKKSVVTELLHSCCRVVTGFIGSVTGFTGFTDCYTLTHPYICLKYRKIMIMDSKIEGVVC